MGTDARAPRARSLGLRIGDRVDLLFRPDIDGRDAAVGRLEVALHGLDQRLRRAHCEAVVEIGADRHEHGIGCRVNRPDVVDRGNF
jgi:hypothetical protein